MSMPPSKHRLADVHQAVLGRGFESAHSADADALAVERLLQAMPFCHLVRRWHCAAYESIAQASSRHKALWLAWASEHFNFSPWGLYGTVAAPVCDKHHRHMKVCANKGTVNEQNKGKPQAMCCTAKEVQERAALKCRRSIWWNDLHELNPAARLAAAQPAGVVA